MVLDCQGERPRSTLGEAEWGFSTPPLSASIKLRESGAAA